ncbi:hypothetical protein [Glaciimonas sp. PAMC28666]|uniref:hypothetical protein n=1 Tax=Glaciimonas sp. PAMC28666 TaxID=2807626 RepID=UPI001964FAA0|nr:hypothetical protein [Glaciimonas sp. PAMC28666]QRX84136.1 hypothetical protein JQN73_08070 [Glaciimonas sp. PAMC28666]
MQCAVAWTMTAVLLSSVVAPVLAETTSRQLAGGTELGTKATARYTLPSGGSGTAVSNMVKTTIQNVFSLALDGNTVVSSGLFHNSIKNTGNVAIEKVTVTATDFVNASAYVVTIAGQDTTLSAASPSVNVTLPAGGLKSGEELPFDAKMVQGVAGKVSGITLLVAGPENASASLKQQYDATVEHFRINPVNTSIDLVRGGEADTVGYNFDVKMSDQEAIMGMSIDLGPDDTTGLGIEADRLILHYASNVPTRLKPGEELAWGDNYFAKLTKTGNKLFLAVRFPAGSVVDKALLNLNILAKNGTPVGVKSFQIQTGKINDINDTSFGANSEKTQPIKVNITGEVKREVGLAWPEGVDGKTNIVPGQIASLPMIIENTGENDDTFVMDQVSSGASLPVGTEFSWDGTTDDAGKPTVTLAAKKKQLITLQVKLPPLVAKEQLALMANVSSGITVSATPKDSKAEPKTLAYNLTIGERAMTFLSDTGASVINRVVVADASTTSVKLRIQNTTEFSSKEAYKISVKNAAGVKVALYEMAGGVCGPDTVSSSTFDTGLIGNGEYQDFCAQVSGSGTNGGIGDKTKVAIMLEAVSKLMTEKPGVTLPLNLYVGQFESTYDKNRTQVIEPLNAVSFYHTIKNTSDIQLTIKSSDIATDIQKNTEWVTKATLVDDTDKPLGVQTVILDTGEKARIQLTITAPTTVPDAETPSTLNVQGVFQYNVALSPLGKYTYAVKGMVSGTLVKDQALDVACNAVPTDNLFSQSSISALPGACVWYRLTLDNKSGADYIDTAITDKAPGHAVISAEAQNTMTHVSASGVETPSAKPVVSNGQVEGKLVGLKNQEKAVLKYRVKIDGLTP